MACWLSLNCVMTFSRSWQWSLGVHRIRVNSISPGLFKSEITEKLMQNHWLNNVAMKVVPLRRFGTSDPALTSLARYLIHDSSEYVSGNNFIVDAGTTLPGLPIYSSLWMMLKVALWNKVLQFSELLSYGFLKFT